MKVFEQCHAINRLLISGKESKAREELIRLLDFHTKESMDFTPIVNHLIRETGLFPYIQTETANWEERYIHEVFKADVAESESLTLHREQSLLLKRLVDGESIAVSAPTSFGKSFVIDAFIQLNKPSNVMIIVPTLALTDETRRRLHRKFGGEYKLITTSDVELSAKNIFIFPQERALNYVDKVDSFDILIVDEFYKASYAFDKTRSPSLIKAMIKLGSKAKQKYYLAPNISQLDENPFTDDMEFIMLDFCTVFLEKHLLYKEIEDEERKGEVLVQILNRKSTKSLIYVGTYSNITKVSTLALANFEIVDNKLLSFFSKWLSVNYEANWSLTNLVRRGFGIHNGRLHRSLSQIQIKLFEEQNGLMNLISTSSIIEGVNTSAENVILWRNRNGRSKLDDFTYKNIIGRGGRMFKYFVGQIYVLEEPPLNTDTDLALPFPDEILGDLDEKKYDSLLSKDQVVKIKVYEKEMSELLGIKVFNRLKSEGAFQSSNSAVIKHIALDMTIDASDWKGLSFLNSDNPKDWDRMLYKIIGLQPGNWETQYKKFVEFIKILSYNWTHSIPELLSYLDAHGIGIDDFFKLERTLTFKFATLLQDVNTLQKEIFIEQNYDIGHFISKVSHAFLPKVVFQLEEYGLPRMISKKIQNARFLDFEKEEFTIHEAIDTLSKCDLDELCAAAKLDEFDKYIMTHFIDGITIATRRAS